MRSQLLIANKAKKDVEMEAAGLRTRLRHRSSGVDEQLAPSAKAVENANDKYDKLVEVNKGLAESLEFKTRAAKQTITRLENKILKLEGDIECLTEDNYCLAREIKGLKKENKALFQKNNNLVEKNKNAVEDIEALKEQNEGFLKRLEGLCGVIQTRRRK